jgi:hypothetical protein
MNLFENFLDYWQKFINENIYIGMEQVEPVIV